MLPFLEKLGDELLARIRSHHVANLRLPTVSLQLAEAPAVIPAVIRFA
jgi:hypothetical protein